MLKNLYTIEYNTITVHQPPDLSMTASIITDLDDHHWCFVSVYCNSSYVVVSGSSSVGCNVAVSVDPVW